MPECNELSTVEGQQNKLQPLSHDYGYIRTPKPVQDLAGRYNRARRKAESEGRDLSTVKTFEQVVKRDLDLHLQAFTLQDGSTVSRWCKLQPFKASQQQVIRYLKHQQSLATTRVAKLKYSIPLDPKTHRQTTGKVGLARIYHRTQDPVLRKVLEIRSIIKMLTNDMPNWKPGPDGRVHATFGYSPPTGQFTASSPNLLNASKHTPMGQLFREIIEAPEGYQFAEFDYSRFHIATMGYEAGDESYIKFGRMDCHTIFTSHVLAEDERERGRLKSIAGLDEGIQLDWSEEKIREATKAIRAVPEWELTRNAQCKHALLGINNGLTPWGLHARYKSQIPSRARAEVLHRVIVGMFPKVERYKLEITRKADRLSYLMDDWGQRREFFDVFTPTLNKVTGEWVDKHGSQYEKALTFRLQAGAFGMIKGKLKEVDGVGGCESWNYMVSIHDSLIFMPRVERVRECVEVVREIMEAPCLEMKGEACPEGLMVGVDVEVGRNWRKWGSEGNPGGMRGWTDE